jgi:hypothetical protein
MTDPREQWLKPELLRPNPWNPNKMDEFMFQKELNSITRFGFVTPIIIRTTPEGWYQIIDGEHRWKAAKQLEMAEIPVWNLGVISDVDAKQLTVVLNETRGTAERDKLGELLKDLLTTETSQSLLDVLPFSVEQFGELAQLPKFDWNEFENQVTKPGSASTKGKWVERIYRMPVEAAEVLDDAIRKVKQNVDAEYNDSEFSDWQAIELLAAEYLGT